MDKPFVSVIIPSFNRYKYLINAIKSVESQEYKNYEIIVINDGSTEPEYYENNFNENVRIVHPSKIKKRLTDLALEQLEILELIRQRKVPCFS